MDQDPSIFIILSLNTHLEVDYSTTHIIDRQGELCGTRVRHDKVERDPYNELSAAIDWGGDALSDYYQDGFVRADG